MNEKKSQDSSITVHKDIDVVEIMNLIKHRYPMLLIDRILYADDSKVTALKNVSINEPYFNGHFPGYPVMPGVLMLEAMAQAAGVGALINLEQSERSKYIYYYVSVNDAKFKGIVTPGDTLIINTECTVKRSKLWKFQCTINVEEKIVAEANIGLFADKIQ